jgi:hypothetical protein
VPDLVPERVLDLAGAGFIERVIGHHLIDRHGHDPVNRLQMRHIADPAPQGKDRGRINQGGRDRAARIGQVERAPRDHHPVEGQILGFALGEGHVARFDPAPFVQFAEVVGGILDALGIDVDLGIVDIDRVGNRAGGEVGVEFALGVDQGGGLVDLDVAVKERLLVALEVPGPETGAQALHRVLDLIEKGAARLFGVGGAGDDLPDFGFLRFGVAGGVLRLGRGFEHPVEHGRDVGHRQSARCLRRCLRLGWRRGPGRASRGPSRAQPLACSRQAGVPPVTTDH